MLPQEDFVDELIKEFNENGFYSQPKETKLYLIINGVEEVIGNAVVANIEEANEKIPVYSFNSSQYAKFLQGKEIVTGVLALRKITVSNFLSLIRKEIKNDDSKEKALLFQQQADEIAKIRNDEFASEFFNALLDQVEYYERKSDSEFDSGTGNKNSLIYYMEQLASSNADAKLKIVYEGKMGSDASPHLNIKDVLFVKKQTEINVDKADIIEVYSFIGNPDY
ncbi:MAG: hypothetical protein ACLT40_01575 [Fusobacterium sp.]